MWHFRRAPEDLPRLFKCAGFVSSPGANTSAASRILWLCRLQSPGNGKLSGAILVLLALPFLLYLTGCGSGSAALPDVGEISTDGGGTSSYEVNLTWDAPASSFDPVAGYNIYRAVSGSSTYQLLNWPLETSTSYTDTTVVNNTTYIYYVESVDDGGNRSAPSNMFTVTIP
jgi:hypothetical protein